MLKKLLLLVILSTVAVAQVKVPPTTISGPNQCAIIGIASMAQVGITVTGSFSATLTPQVVMQGQAAQNVQVTPLDASGNFGQPVQTVTAAGTYLIAVSPYDSFQLCATNYVSGSPVIYLNATANASSGATLGIVTTRSDAGTPYSCTITLSTNTTTQCQAAPSAGLRNYVQSYQLYTTAAGTVTTVGLNYGTSTNCGSGTAALTPVYANTTAAPVNTVGVFVNLSGSGLVPPTGNAICGVQAGTTAGTTVVTVNGFVAP